MYQISIMHVARAESNQTLLELKVLMKVSLKPSHVVVYVYNDPGLAPQKLRVQILLKETRNL